MSKEEYKNIVWSFCVWGGLTLGTWAFIALDTNDKTEYFVTDKGNNKLILNDTKAGNIRRVMRFDKEPTFKEYYKFIEPGDVLCGKNMNNDTIMNSYNGITTPRLIVPKIRRINGRSASTVIQERSQKQR